MTANPKATATLRSPFVHGPDSRRQFVSRSAPDNLAVSGGCGMRMITNMNPSISAMIGRQMNNHEKKSRFADPRDWRDSQWRSSWAVIRPACICSDGCGRRSAATSLLGKFRCVRFGRRMLVSRVTPVECPKHAKRRWIEHRGCHAVGKPHGQAGGNRGEYGDYPQRTGSVSRYQAPNLRPASPAVGFQPSAIETAGAKKNHRDLASRYITSGGWPNDTANTDTAAQSASSSAQITTSTATITAAGAGDLGPAVGPSGTVSQSARRGLPCGTVLRRHLGTQSDGFRDDSQPFFIIVCPGQISSGNAIFHFSSSDGVNQLIIGFEFRRLVDDASTFFH